MFLIVYGPSAIKKRNIMVGVADIWQVGQTGGMIKALVITIEKIRLFGGQDCILYHGHHCYIQKNIGTLVLIFLLLLPCQKNASALIIFLSDYWTFPWMSSLLIAFFGEGAGNLLHWLLSWVSALIPEEPKKLVFKNPVLMERDIFILTCSCSKHKKYPSFGGYLKYWHPVCNTKLNILRWDDTYSSFTLH